MPEVSNLPSCSNTTAEQDKENIAPKAIEEYFRKPTTSAPVKRVKQTCSIPKIKGSSTIQMSEIGRIYAVILKLSFRQMRRFK